MLLFDSLAVSPPAAFADGVLAPSIIRGENRPRRGPSVVDLAFEHGRLVAIEDGAPNVPAHYGPDEAGAFIAGYTEGEQCMAARFDEWCAEREGDAEYAESVALNIPMW